MGRSEVDTVTAVTRRSAARREADDLVTARAIARQPGLPGGRAAVGALLMTTAAVGVFAAYLQAAEGPTDELVVAAHAIHVGEEIAAVDLRVVRGELPGDARRTSFDAVEDVIGRVALGPIGDGEIVQAGSITTERAGTAGHEIAITIPREHLAVGRLKEGERVDVFVTYDDHTQSVVRDAEVVQLVASSDGSLTSGREVTVVVAAPSGDVVAALVHALRTGDVTVVRSTFRSPTDEGPLEFDVADGTEARTASDARGSGPAGE